MKKYEIAIIAFAVISSLTGFTDISNTVNKSVKSALPVANRQTHSENPPDQANIPTTGKSNKYLSSWD